MARQKGLEPLTSWFVVKHSIQLSYWRKNSPQNELLEYITTFQIKNQEYILICDEKSKPNKQSQFKSPANRPAWTGPVKKANEQMNRTSKNGQ